MLRRGFGKFLQKVQVLSGSFEKFMDVLRSLWNLGSLVKHVELGRNLVLNFLNE